MNQTVMVTGASGYIGGQTMLQLRDLNYQVVAVDWEPMPDHLDGIAQEFICDDFSSAQVLAAIQRHQPIAIIHCAGTSLVGPSVKNPELYYENNFVRTKKMLDFLVKHKISSRVIFSSSAAVYGEPVITPCQEEDPPLPISPYGESKLMIEMMLQAYKTAYDLDFVAFRYFNACGADSRGRHGQAHGATHIIARVLESVRDKTEFRLFGNDYPTVDGTCVRDYVHVEDLADAHIRALSISVPSGIYNLSSGTGASNQEIVIKAEEITGLDVQIVIEPRRPGDPAVLTAMADRFQQVSAWQPRYNLDDIVKHAWAWYVR